MNHSEEEVRAALARYVETRLLIEGGSATWSDLAPFFTDDAVYIDPAWGRVEGIDAIREFFVESMTGLEDWRFPIEFTAVDGNNVVIKWLQVLPSGHRQTGWTRLRYAGDGKFDYDEDTLNMAHVLEDLAESGWRPGPGFVPPPAKPNRDFSLP